MWNSASEPDDRQARWKRIKEIFEAVVVLPQDERDRYVGGVCGQDSELKHEIDRLLAHHDAAGSFLDGAAWSPAIEHHGRLQEGVLLVGRFQILRHIGSGGMGEVYQAFDREIGEEVAVKTVSQELVRNEQITQRLKKELQLARRVTHPNICRIFDLDRVGSGSDECLFLTMEFLTGETLASYLKRRRSLTAAETAALVQQIASGLAAAHEAGVLHRDLKPANIMLQMEEGCVTRAVVMDFGVATSVRLNDDARLTRTGEMPGTLAYMAPELLAGAPASPSSDIYALGLILLEMRTGGIVLRPEGPGSGIDRLEPAWRTVILRCLESDPAKRFATARQAYESFLGLQAAWPRWKRAGRWWLWGAATLAIASAAVIATRNPPYPRATMLITPVANFTQDSQLDGLTEMLRQQLSQSAVLSLWNSGRLPVVLGEMRRSVTEPIEASVWREIALRENAPLVVFSNVTRLGDGYVLSVRVEETGPNPARAQREWDHTERAVAKPQLFDAVRETTLWMRKLGGEGRAELSLHDQLPQDTTTASWEALDLFHKAEQQKQNGDPEKALAILDQAIVTDPKFAMAHSRLGDILTSLKRDREALEHWAVAIDETHKQSLTKREEYRIRALYGLDSGALGSAEGPLLLWLQEYPQDYLPAYYLGYLYRVQGKLEESLRLLDVANSRHGDEYYIASSLAQTHLARGAYSTVMDVCTRLRRGGHAAAADQYEGAARLLGGDGVTAVQVFTRMTERGDISSRSRGYLLLARAEAERGRWAQAIQALDRGVEFDLSENRPADRAEKLLALAYLRRQQSPVARGYALEASRAYHSPEICMMAGTILARLGFIDIASSQMECLGAVDRFPRFQAMRLQLQGEIEAAKKRPTGAIQFLERAASLDAPLRAKDYLARALALSGDVERARMIYREILKRPGILWQNAETALPGVQREIADEALRLSDQSR